MLSDAIEVAKQAVKEARAKFDASLDAGATEDWRACKAALQAAEAELERHQLVKWRDDMQRLRAERLNR